MRDYQITLTLTSKEIELLRNCMSELGKEDLPNVSLQLKIAEALLHSGYVKSTSHSIKGNFYG